MRSHYLNNNNLNQNNTSLIIILKSSGTNSSSGSPLAYMPSGVLLRLTGAHPYFTIAPFHPKSLMFLEEGNNPTVAQEGALKVLQLEQYSYKPVQNIPPSPSAYAVGVSGPSMSSVFLICKAQGKPSPASVPRAAGQCFQPQWHRPYFPHPLRSLSRLGQGAWSAAGHPHRPWLSSSPLVPSSSCSAVCLPPRPLSSSLLRSCLAYHIFPHPPRHWREPWVYSFSPRPRSLWIGYNAQSCWVDYQALRSPAGLY